MNEVIGIDSIPRLNVTGAAHGEVEISGVEALILERNKIDLSLYEFGLSLLQTKVIDLPEWH